MAKLLDPHSKAYGSNLPKHHSVWPHNVCGSYFPNFFILVALCVDANLNPCFPNIRWLKT